MSINDSMNQLLDLKNKTILSNQIEFVKHLVTVSALLLPLLSLLPLNLSADKDLFRSLLVSLAMCTLSGSANLYIILIQHRKMAEELRLDILERLQTGNTQKMIASKYNKRLKFSELLCILSFLTSVILIVIIVW